MKNKTDKQLDMLEQDNIKDIDAMFLECINDLNNRLKSREETIFSKRVVFGIGMIAGMIFALICLFISNIITPICI